MAGGHTVCRDHGFVFTLLGSPACPVLSKGAVYRIGFQFQEALLGGCRGAGRRQGRRPEEQIILDMVTLVANVTNRQQHTD